MTDAPNDRYTNAPYPPLTTHELWQSVMMAFVKLAAERDVELTNEWVDVFTCERGKLLLAEQYECSVVVTPVFGAFASDPVSIKVKRVTKPVTTDGSLVTSQSDGPVQTGRPAIDDRGDASEDDQGAPGGAR